MTDLWNRPRELERRRREWVVTANPGTFNFLSAASPESQIVNSMLALR
jgi:hypothetical protein